MAHLIVKDLPDGLVQELRQLAESRGQTLKACVAAIVRAALLRDHATIGHDGRILGLDRE